MVLYEMQFAPMLSFASACGGALSHVLFLLSSNFQSWGHKLGKVKWKSHLTRSQACSANGATIAKTGGFILSSPPLVLKWIYS